MPDIDVSEILTDPDFLDSTLVCVRSVQTVGADGIAVLAQTKTRFAGVVTQDAGAVLRRIAAGERITGSISVVTYFRLLAGSPTNTADVVQWGTNSYTVSQVSDYSRYGAGFVEAICDLVALSG